MEAQRQEILQAVAAAVYAPADALREDARIKDLALDSIDYLEVMLALNTRFDVPVDPVPMGGIETVGDLVDYVIAHQGEARGTASLGRF